MRNEPKIQALRAGVWPSLWRYMTISMNGSHVVSIAQLQAFAKVSKDIEFQGASRKEKYQWV